MPVDKSSVRIRRMFAEIARQYDLLNQLLSFGVDRWWRRRTARLVPPSGEGPVLDVCAGTGDLALAYWRCGGRRASVVAVDFCRPMLALALKKCRSAGAEKQIRLLEADARQLPFCSGSFQIVCVAFGLRNVSDTDQGLREMVRVCWPGGRVAVLEFSMPTAWPLRTLYAWYFHRVVPRVGQVLARNRQGAYNYLSESVGEFSQAETLAERMKAAGLHAVCCHRLTFGVATLYVGVK